MGRNLEPPRLWNHTAQRELEKRILLRAEQYGSLSPRMESFPLYVSENRVMQVRVSQEKYRKTRKSLKRRGYIKRYYGVGRWSLTEAGDDYRAFLQDFRPDYVEASVQACIQALERWHSCASTSQSSTQRPTREQMLLFSG